MSHGASFDFGTQLFGKVEDEQPGCYPKKVLRYLWDFKGAILGFLLFVIFLGVRINPDHPQSAEQSMTVGITLLVIIWWVTEPIPIAITSLLPIALIPMCGIADTFTVASQYATNITFLLLGSFFMAVAMEKWNLHLRLVYNLLINFGTSRKMILVAFMIIAACLSAVMSNATTALILMPIIKALSQNVQTGKQTAFLPKRIERAYLFGVGWAAAVGGTMTPIGTPPNLILLKLVHTIYPRAPQIGFLVWMAYAVPFAIFFLSIACLWLLWRYFGCCGNVKRKQTVSMEDVSKDPDAYQLYNEEDGGDDNVDVKSVLQSQLDSLGPTKFAEYYVGFTFIAAILLWIFRSDFNLTDTADCGSWRGCMPGWHRIFSSPLNASLYDPPLTTESREAFVEDSVVAILLSIPFFILPARDGKGSPILDWESALKIPWDILWLIGGGFALALAIQSSGLDQFLAEGLSSGLGGSPKEGLLFLLSLILALLVTVSVNYAMAAIVVPVFGTFAISQGVNPLYYCIPCTVILSYAFVLPTSSPVNAIIYSSRKISMKNMAKHGTLMTVIGWLLGCLCWLAYGQFAFKANTFNPDEWWTTTQIATNATLRAHLALVDANATH